ncbi:hypothetical protein EV186_1011702 [Labedaea rhizosphaerae]|uniref:Uncharacterized protein n=1 Tax=Labedaea rhizosphaerae TaxID=598644 RepID=A0A4R6SNY4_LABRH|nr:hypothetical protein EV186_1011702 [Labedaea rhizosphaerae]
MTAATFAVAALLGACGTGPQPAQQSGQQPGQGQPTPGGCRSGPVRVTDADNGKTLCVTTGSAVTLVLRAPDATTRWSAVRSDSDGLEPLAVSGAVDPAGVTSAAFTAEHHGTAHLSSSRPACGGDGHVKCHAVLGFTVTVTVE